ncbi:MAG: LptF/LptG family permease [candidate division WOR-3 bacterium]|nr:LptF/LptG family permease [candidate division WOR-3 bacterium]
MKKIYKYVLSSFLRHLFLALIVLIFIYIIINLFDNLGRYLSRNIPFRDIIVYYLYLIPSYTVLLIPVAAIIGVFFIFGYMTKYREIIALKAQGMDINNLFILILITGLFISVITFIFQETVMVWAQARLTRHRTLKIDKRPLPQETRRHNFFYHGEDNWIYYIKDFNPRDSTLKNVMLWKLDSRRRIVKRIDASSGKFSGYWRFNNATVREFDSLDNEKISHYQELELPELKERPVDFSRQPKPVEEMNFVELIKFVKKRTRAGEDVAKENVELNYRFSFPFITVILLLVCLPISVILRRGGVAIGLGISIVLAFVYWGFIQSARAYGYAGLIHPLLAAWLPNIFFIIIGIISFLSIRR